MDTITLSFKCPDAIDAAIENYINTNYPDGETDTQADKISEVRQELERWIEWGEYVHIVIDLDTGTASVKEVKKC